MLICPDTVFFFHPEASCGSDTLLRSQIRIEKTLELQFARAAEALKSRQLVESSHEPLGFLLPWSFIEAPFFRCPSLQEVLRYLKNGAYCSMGPSKCHQPDKARSTENFSGGNPKKSFWYSAPSPRHAIGDLCSLNRSPMCKHSSTPHRNTSSCFSGTLTHTRRIPSRSFRKTRGQELEGSHSLLLIC